MLADDTAVTPPETDEPATENQVRGAIQSSIKLLEAASAGSAKKRVCFTCHNQALPILALTEARHRGFVVDAENLKTQLAHTHAHLKRGRKGYSEGRGQGGKIDTAGYALWALEVGGHDPDDVTEAVAHYLIESNQDEGYWKRSSDRPPSEASHFTTTYLAIRALSQFATAEQSSESVQRIDRARSWLDQQSASDSVSDTEDLVFLLRSYDYLTDSADEQKAAADKLLDLQQEDGGWTQKPEMSSDAYATATALVALLRSGQSDRESQAVQRGVRYLLDTQLEDGSWKVVSRSKPFQKYYETGFPHEKNQFISCTATSWAVVALLLSLE